MKMKKSKQEKLENAGWKAGSADDFLNCNPSIKCINCGGTLAWSARQVGSGMCHACGHKLYFEKQLHLEMKRLQCELTIAKHDINELRDTLPDSIKLKTLARFFDHLQDQEYWGKNNTQTDVQDDLRIWAEDIEKILHSTEAIAKED